MFYVICQHERYSPEAHKARECTAFDIFELCLLQQPALWCSPTTRLVMVLFSTFREAKAINAAPMQQALNPETALRPQRTALSCTLNTGQALEPGARPTWVLTTTQEEMEGCSLTIQSVDVCRCMYTQRQFVHAAAQGHASSNRDFSLSLRLGAGSL